MPKGNPNPIPRLSPEARAKGQKAGGAKAHRNALERQAFEQAFTEAAQDILGVEAYELRKRLIAKLCAEALKGKQWAMEKVIAYLFGQPQASVDIGGDIQGALQIILKHETV